MPARTRRTDGRLVATLQVNGTRRYVYAHSPRALQEKLAALQQQAGQMGALPAPGRRTVNDLLDHWLHTAAPSLRPKTIAGYEELTTRYVRPALGRVRLSRLAPEHLQSLYVSLQQRGLRREPTQVHRLLHRALRFAVLWRWLPENPADRVLRPTYQAPRKTMWTPEQARAFLAGIDGHRLDSAWTLLVYTGMRLGECLALRWSDVDLAHGTVSVQRTAARIRRERVETPPKTRAGERTVALPSEAIAALRRQSARQATWRLKAGPAWTDSGAVFTGRYGRPLAAHDVQRRTREICLRLNLPPLTPHGLRHLHASLLLANGITLPEVARRLGHAHPGITATIYSHVVGADRRAAEALQAALTPSNPDADLAAE